MKPNLGGKFIVGVDLGGTNVRAAVTDREGGLLCKPVDKESLAHIGFETTVEQIVGAIEEAVQKAEVRKEEICGVGMGVPGQHRSDEGIVLWSPNFKDLAGKNLLAPISERVGLPIWMGNDVNVAALGEFRFGAGKGTSSMVMLTLGTGIGGGIILNGELWAGVTEGGGEIGHMIVNAGGPIAQCGHSGCLEAMAAAQAIINRAALKVQQGRKTAIAEMTNYDIGEITPKLVATAAEKGDQVAIEVLEETGYWVGVGVVSAVNLLNPEMVVIGGRIAEAGQHLFGAIRRTVEANAIRGSLAALRIEHAALGDNAGIMGGVVLVLKAMEGAA